jgi:GR25 family glycosyltransferase involved in LPS biosynthesis
MKLPEYDFYPNLDSPGSDIKFIPDKDVSSLRQIADCMPDCLGFNTLGYLKNKICDQKDFIRFNNVYGGIYVKRVEKRDFKYKILCVNLLRRPDRKNNMINKFKQNGIENFEFFEAVDGNTLQPTEEIRKLFLGNDFNYRKNYTGCNFSQYKIHEQLAADPVNDFYIIFEDDIADMDNNFMYRLNQLMTQFQYGIPDIVFLGYYIRDCHLVEYGHLYNKSDNPELALEPLRKNIYFGGMHSYIISKNGANKILDYVHTNHITRAMDWFVTTIPDLFIYECRPHISFADYVRTYNSTVDSDIQKEF